MTNTVHLAGIPACRRRVTHHCRMYVESIKWVWLQYCSMAQESCPECNVAGPFSSPTFGQRKCTACGHRGNSGAFK